MTRLLARLIDRIVRALWPAESALIDSIQRDSTTED